MNFLRSVKKWELILTLLSLAIFVAGSLFLWISTFKLPDLQSFGTRKVSQSTKIFDRAGKVLLYDVNQGVRRTVIPSGDISINIKNATVAVEDSDFYEHRGIKPTAILRAIFADLGSGSYSQGGSTITQQVVKNALLTSEKKISRKIKEWVLAFKLEQAETKDQILTIYLNEAPYGGNIYGIEEAALSFFGKKASDLTIAEAAYLASLPNAPTFYSPYGNNRARLEERKNLVLKKMLEKKFIAKSDYDSALAERVIFLAESDTGIKAPHFVIFVKQYLESKYGKDALEKGGLRVTTTLDVNLQDQAEAIVKRFAALNKENFNASNAALVAIDPKTGDILVMVGSRDYFDKEIDGNFNVAIAHRQPGSAFKPFAYAEAFNKGYTPDTVLFDLQTEFSSECNPDGTPIKAGDDSKCYMPGNYDEKFRGPITMRDALAQSVNIPAIKTLYLAGLRDSLNLAKNMGIGSLSDSDQYGLTLVLGGGEVSLLDITSAYGVFGDNGDRNPYRSILKVEDGAGNVLESAESHPRRVLPEQTALLINNILSDNKARAPLYGSDSPLLFPGRDLAAKTGTTNDYRDAWIIGYTPSLAVGAWAGNNDNSPMAKKVAGFIVAPLWRAFMDGALKNLPNDKFKKPAAEDESRLPAVLRGFWQGGKTYVIDKISGKLATNFTPPELREEKVVRQVHSILYWADKDNPRGSKTRNPEDDPQFKLWEAPVLKWAKENNLPDETESSIPTASDSVHRPELAPVITISSPNPIAIYDKNKAIPVTFNATSAFPFSRAEFFINGLFAGSANQPPFKFSFTPKNLSSLAAKNNLRVVGYDSVANRGQAETVFNVAF
jgi:penicillin-binding protein 1C